jgi:hypothetical protein
VWIMPEKRLAAPMAQAPRAANPALPTAGSPPTSSAQRVQQRARRRSPAIARPTRRRWRERLSNQRHRWPARPRARRGRMSDARPWQRSRRSLFFGRRRRPKTRRRRGAIRRLLRRRRPHR